MTVVIPFPPRPRLRLVRPPPLMRGLEPPRTLRQACADEGYCPRCWERVERCGCPMEDDHERAR